MTKTSSTESKQLKHIMRVWNWRRRGNIGQMLMTKRDPEDVLSKSCFDVYGLNIVIFGKTKRHLTCIFILYSFHCCLNLHANCIYLAIDSVEFLQRGSLMISQSFAPKRPEENDLFSSAGG